VTQPARWKTLLAFGIIYFVGGQPSSPFVLASVKSRRSFFARCVSCSRTAGLRLGIRAGRAVAERAAVDFCHPACFLIFVVDYGLLFWASSVCHLASPP